MEVLIVSFNSVDELRQTLSTLLEHTPAPPIEMTVAVLDNASADGSADMVGDEFPQIRLVRSTTNLGFGKATNQLAATSEADYLFLLNSDIVVTQDVVSPLVNALRQAPDVVVSAPRLQFPNGDLQYSANRFPSLSYEFARIIKGTRLARLISGLFDAETTVNYVHCVGPVKDTHRPWQPDSIWATAWLMRRADIVRYGLFDESFPLYDEDLDFCVRAKARGKKLVYLPDASLIHLGGASSTAARKSAAMRAARHHYYEVHHGRFSAICFDMLEHGLPAIVALVAALPRRIVARHG